MKDLRLSYYGESCLTAANEPVEPSHELVDVAAEMLKIMYANGGIGLAGPQVGLNKRIFVWDLRDGSGIGAILNPEIIRVSRISEIEQEGCLSIPTVNFLIPRKVAVTLAGTSLYGVKVKIEADGLLARLFQHETEHLSSLLNCFHWSKDQWHDASEHEYFQHCKI